MTEHRAERVDAWGLRHLVYERFAATGEPPSPAELALAAGSAQRRDELLADLHARHALVPDGRGGVLMALPFSAVPTGHRVVSTDRAWWANCAWDALAIPLLLGVDARIEAEWLGGGAVDITIEAGELIGSDGLVHFARPAATWWDDIVET